MGTGNLSPDSSFSSLLDAEYRSYILLPHFAALDAGVSSLKVASEQFRVPAKCRGQNRRRSLNPLLIAILVVFEVVARALQPLRRRDVLKFVNDGFFLEVARKFGIYDDDLALEIRYAAEGLAEVVDSGIGSYELVNVRADEKTLGAGLRFGGVDAGSGIPTIVEVVDYRGGRHDYGDRNTD
jgi:hypothetical protein